VPEPSVIENEASARVFDLTRLIVRDREVGQTFVPCHCVIRAAYGNREKTKSKREMV
jgi:hypothetical protein